MIKIYIIIVLSDFSSPSIIAKTHYNIRLFCHVSRIRRTNNTFTVNVLLRFCAKHKIAGYIVKIKKPVSTEGGLFHAEKKYFQYYQETF